MAQGLPRLLQGAVTLWLLTLSIAHKAHIKLAASNGIQFDKYAMTSVTIDVCLFKQGLNTSLPVLLALTRNLGGYNSTLRIGGRVKPRLTLFTCR